MKCARTVCNGVASSYGSPETMNGPLPQPPGPASAIKAILVLFVVGILIRLPLAWLYQPTMYDDSSTYVTLARQLQHLDFSDYIGWRTPGYPVLLLVAGFSNQWLWLLQSSLGIGISVLIFRMTWEASGSVRLGTVVGLLQSLALNQLFFEAAVLAETLCTFLVVLSTYATSRILLHGRATLMSGAFSGLVATLAALTRPIFIIFGPLCLALYFARFRFRRLPLYVAFVLAFGLPIILWMSVNQVTLGYFGMTT